MIKLLLQHGSHPIFGTNWFEKTPKTGTNSLLFVIEVEEILQKYLPVKHLLKLENINGQLFIKMKGLLLKVFTLWS